MKNSAAKKVFITAAMLMAASTGFAHDQTGQLGNAATAIDIYQVHCYNDGGGIPAFLYFQIQDSLPVAAPVVSAQVTNGIYAANTTDAVDGNAAYSPLIKVKGVGDSFFTVTVDKTKLGMENYTFQYHCETSGNAHTGTDIIQLVNQ